MNGINNKTKISKLDICIAKERKLLYTEESLFTIISISLLLLLCIDLFYRIFKILLNLEWNCLWGKMSMNWWYCWWTLCRLNCNWFLGIFDDVGLIWIVMVLRIKHDTVNVVGLIKGIPIESNFHIH